MMRTTIAVLLTVSLALLAGSSVGGCNKAEREERRRQKEIERQEKLEASESGKPQNKFEESEDPPFSAETRFAAGQLAESQGNFENAIAQYREALKLNPNYKDAMFRLGGVYTQTRRYDDAIATWQRYLKLTNQSPQAYSNLALCYETAGRIEEAEQTYKAGIDRDPSAPACRINYGLMLAKQGRTDEAIAQLSSVLRPAEVHYNLGAVCEQKGKREEAKAYYRKALELDPKLRDARSRLAALNDVRR